MEAKYKSDVCKYAKYGSSQVSVGHTHDNLVYVNSPSNLQHFKGFGMVKYFKDKKYVVRAYLIFIPCSERWMGKLGRLYGMFEDVWCEQTSEKEEM